MPAIYVFPYYKLPGGGGGGRGGGGRGGGRGGGGGGRGGGGSSSSSSGSRGSGSNSGGKGGTKGGSGGSGSGGGSSSPIRGPNGVGYISPEGDYYPYYWNGKYLDSKASYNLERWGKYLCYALVGLGFIFILVCTVIVLCGGRKGLREKIKGLATKTKRRLTELIKLKPIKFGNPLKLQKARPGWFMRLFRKSETQNDLGEVVPRNIQQALHRNTEKSPIRTVDPRKPNISDDPEKLEPKHDLEKPELSYNPDFSAQMHLDIPALDIPILPHLGISNLPPPEKAKFKD